MTTDRTTSLAWIHDLYRLGQSPRLLDDPAGLYHQLLAHIVDGFDARSGSLALLAEDGASLVIVAGIDLPPGVVGSTIAPGSGVLGWVAQNARPLLINGDFDASRFPGITRHRDRAAPGSALCWPLRLHEQTIGALSVNRPAADPAFGEADRDRGTDVLNLVGLALDNIQLRLEQQKRIDELQDANRKLAEARDQLLQAEKMASIGQLAAGVAHEINNPVGYVASNLGTLGRYVDDVLALLDASERIEALVPAEHPARQALEALKSTFDIAWLRDDLRKLLAESNEGLERVRKIVLDLKTFSHVDKAEWQPTDLHRGLDSTLNIVWNELKYKADVIKEYGQIPEVECIPSQINQVFMNLLVNAAQAIETRGSITLRTGAENDHVWIEVTDTGQGMAPEIVARIFDPFFTTKPVGKGTGLGLSLSYNIVNQHHGSIDVRSTPGVGTTFRVRLPRTQPEPAG